jgi:spore maturation protein CgeB
MFRILYLGDQWHGSCARACEYALRRLGCDVLVVDPATCVPLLRRLSSRAALRVARPWLSREYNDLILDAAREFQPDFLFAFKGNLVQAVTLRALRKQGIPLYNYYPDRVLMEAQTELGKSLAEYDCFFDTKRYWDGDASRMVSVRERVFVPHGYDPEVHRPLPLTEKDRAQYGCDVSLIANWSPTKETAVRELIAEYPDVDLRIWGAGWRRCESEAIQKLVRHWSPTGDQYSRMIQAARINLGIMGVTPAAKDETTTRTYEIPACGAFMLHERTPEIHELFEEGKEVECFASARELAEKIRYYLARGKEREAIAAAGYARCVPAYSYDRRVAEIIRWHCTRHGVEVPAALESGGKCVVREAVVLK